MRTYDVEVISNSDHKRDDRGGYYSFKGRKKAAIRFAIKESLKESVHECFLEVFEGDTEDEMDRVNSFYYQDGKISIDR